MACMRYPKHVPSGFLFDFCFPRTIPVQSSIDHQLYYNNYESHFNNYNFISVGNRCVRATSINGTKQKPAVDHFKVIQTTGHTTETA